MNEIKDGKIVILDSLRAFAALSVCFFHFVCTTTGYVKNEQILKLFSFGQYGVQTFFVISGFVIPWAMHNAGYGFGNFFSFMLKRLARLEPPYLFSIILALTLFYCRQHFLGMENLHMTVSTKQILLHFGYLIPFFEGYKWLNQVYWTLSIEFQYYFLIAILFVPLMQSKKLARILITLVLLALGWLSNEKFLLYWLPFFLIGIVVFLNKAGLIKAFELKTLLVILLAFCIYRFPFASVIYGAIPVFFLLYKPNLKIPALHTFGKFSYSIYLIHPLLGASFINILSHRFTSPFQQIVVIITGILITLVSGWLMYIVIERPSKTLSSSIKYKKS